MPHGERTITPPAWLRLRGHEATPARVELLYRPRSRRLTRASLYLLGFWVLTPLVLVIPPHVPWALATFLLGIYFFWSNWTRAYEIRALEGACPHCGNRLTVEPGSTIRFPYRLTCYQCHHQPYLEIEHAPEQATRPPPDPG